MKKTQFLKLWHSVLLEFHKRFNNHCFEIFCVSSLHFFQLFLIGSKSLNEYKIKIAQNWNLTVDFLLNVLSSSRKFSNLVLITSAHTMLIQIHHWSHHSVLRIKRMTTLLLGYFSRFDLQKCRLLLFPPRTLRPNPPSTLSSDFGEVPTLFCGTVEGVVHT